MRLMRKRGSYCPFVNKLRVVLVTIMPSKVRTEGNFPDRFSSLKSVVFFSEIGAFIIHSEN
jgi:hypothetical protein